MQTITVWTKERKEIDLLDFLPHGSGIDGKWTLTISPSNIYLYNGFHCMDQNGMYEGWADFTITIPRMIYPEDWYKYFRLSFRGNYSQYMNQKHMLRDYLEELFHESLHYIQSATIKE